MGPVSELMRAVLSGNRAALARAITVVESKSIRPLEQQKKLQFIRQLHEKHYERKQDSIRLAITGSPGSGKSTFIEAFGMHLIEKEKKKVAVLAVDPSSAIRGGSILADKTRMPNLTSNENAFIRPSPSRLHLGGVTQATGNSILLCEAAGYDVVIVETVGVGQSEYDVAGLCDIFTLLVAPSSGDELQAIKKGIVEMANVIIVTKSDGDLIRAARRMRGEIRSATKYIDYTERPDVLLVSSVTKEGIVETWKTIEKMINADMEVKAARRQEKKLQLLRTHLINELFEILGQHLSYEQYEERIKKEPTLSLTELVQDIIYKDLYTILQNCRSQSE